MSDRSWADDARPLAPVIPLRRVVVEAEASA